MENNFDSMLNVSAVPQDDKKAAFIAKSKNNRNRCYELSEQITNEVAADSGKFQQYLDVQARFDRYTANNALLILAQRPDAERLGDKGYWRVTMEFKDVLNRYMERTGCSARDLAERSGLSTATISRYRSGDRVPEADSRQLENLAKGIAAIAAEKKIREMEEEAVRQALSEQAQGPGIEIEKLRLNFDTLLKTLSVSVSDLARFLSYDPSYLSRIRKGQRKLSDPQKFTADAFLKLDAKTEGTRRSILSSLPLYTADDELVFQVLRDNRVSEKNQIRIMEHIAFQRELTEEILSHDSIFEAYPNFSKDEFAQYPMTLSLAGAFYEEDIVYTYEQYREHLEMMKRFSQMHKNYHIEENKSPAFRHIQILIHEGSWAIVSKEKTPAIHFVIRHPKMREAMENITMPIVEGEEYK
ncbi:MAG: helix-turn-helix domain-containing protein [Lachnospiraceae bacterium]|nr:helix-turn-helix domain-containing protein [Lachnospiraceae bacterium]BCZ26908.1 hypothetical protein EUBC25_09950 [Claveliimonas bilis]